MGFSQEWETIYQTGAHNSIWPWSDVVSKVNRYYKGENGIKVLELGCGAGANIPFFVSFGAEYCGVEGSITEVKKLNQRFSGQNVLVKQGDFTKEIPFDTAFDLILDRSSVTHNTTKDIQKTIQMVFNTLKPGGYYFGIDWFSTKYGIFSDDSEEYDEIDSHTRVFRSGYFEGLGNVHFSDEKHIRELFSEHEIVELYEKVQLHVFPEKQTIAHWNFVVKK